MLRPTVGDTWQILGSVGRPRTLRGDLHVSGRGVFVRGRGHYWYTYGGEPQYLLPRGLPADGGIVYDIGAAKGGSRR